MKHTAPAPVIFPVPAVLRRERSRGFTLIEAMIVVALVAILGMIAYPAYTEYGRRAALAEASDLLTNAKLAMDQYYLTHRKFEGSDGEGGPCAGKQGKSFVLSCTKGDDPALTYTFTATGKAGTYAAGFTYTINQSDVRSTQSSAQGWPSSAACWIFKGGDSC
jgi:type IV pilus assembly protein PilE